MFPEIFADCFCTEGIIFAYDFDENISSESLKKC